MSVPYDPYKPPSASLDAPAASDLAAPVPASIVQILGQTRPWVRLIAGLVFVGLGLCLTVAVFVGLFQRRAQAMAFVPMCLVLLFYIPPALSLRRYAAAIQQLQQGGGMTWLEEALAAQKSFWKYMGVFVVVMVGLWIVVFGVGALTTFNVPRH